MLYPNYAMSKLNVCKLKYIVVKKDSDTSKCFFKTMWQPPSSFCCILICFQVCSAACRDDDHRAGSRSWQVKGRSILCHRFCCIDFQVPQCFPASCTSISWDAHFGNWMICALSSSWCALKLIHRHHRLRPLVFVSSSHYPEWPASKRKQKPGFSSFSFFLILRVVKNDLNFPPLPDQYHQFPPLW